MAQLAKDKHSLASSTKVKTGGDSLLSSPESTNAALDLYKTSQLESDVEVLVLFVKEILFVGQWEHTALTISQRTSYSKRSTSGAVFFRFFFVGVLYRALYTPCSTCCRIL